MSNSISLSRDAQELGYTINYILDNPGNAGPVDEWLDCSFSLCKSEYTSEFI